MPSILAMEIRPYLCKTPPAIFDREKYTRKRSRPFLSSPPTPSSTTTPHHHPLLRENQRKQGKPSATSPGVLDSRSHFPDQNFNLNVSDPAPGTIGSRKVNGKQVHGEEEALLVPYLDRELMDGVPLGCCPGRLRRSHLHPTRLTALASLNSWYPQDEATTENKRAGRFNFTRNPDGPT